MGGYESFLALCLEQIQGRDYEIRCRAGTSGFVVMALHGGGIEPGTATLAEAIAGSRHGFYCFRGIGASGNAGLRIPSHLFDEPRALQLAAGAEAVVTVHGCRGSESIVYVGGRDQELKRAVQTSLAAASFSASESERYPGVHPMNLCNRGRNGRGLQLEVSAGLRRVLLKEKRVELEGGEIFRRFVRAIQEALVSPEAKPAHSLMDCPRCLRGRPVEEPC